MVLQMRKIRKARGLSLLELCLLTKIELGNLSRIERGHLFPYAGWRRRIAEALGVPEKELFKPVVEVANDERDADSC